MIGDEFGNAYIDIFKLNDTDKKNKFVTVVIDSIKKINRDFRIDEEDFEEMVTVDGLDFVSKEIININAKAGKLIFNKRRIKEIDKEKELIDLKLNDYKMFIDGDIKKKKVVISYSKKNLMEVHTLKRYLKPLVQNDLIEEPWYCTNLNPADDWDEKIKYKFEEADIVLFMVSEYFYSTPYIIEKEIKTIIDRYNEKGDVKIVPIILEPYDWIRKPPYNLGRFFCITFSSKSY